MNEDFKFSSHVLTTSIKFFLPCKGTYRYPGLEHDIFGSHCFTKCGRFWHPAQTRDPGKALKRLNLKLGEERGMESRLMGRYQDE